MKKGFTVNKFDLISSNKSLFYVLLILETFFPISIRPVTVFILSRISADTIMASDLGFFESTFFFPCCTVSTVISISCGLYNAAYFHLSEMVKILEISLHLPNHPLEPKDKTDLEPTTHSTTITPLRQFALKLGARKQLNKNREYQI